MQVRIGAAADLAGKKLIAFNISSELLDSVHLFMLRNR